MGIVTEITLRLRPRPAAARVALAAFASARAAGDAVSQIVAAGIVPSGLEMMDQGAVRAVEEFVGAGYPQDAAAILLFEVDGGEDEVAREMARGESIARAAGAIEFRIAKDEAERELFWRGRKAAFPAAGRIKSDYYCMDGTIPRRRLGETLEKIAALARAKSLVCVNVFHAGDGNLHPLICFDGASDDETRRALEMGEEIMRLCVAAGGSITGEHGVGVEKLDGMCGQFTDDELSMFHDLKTAFERIRFVESRQGGADFESLRRVRIYARRRRRKPRRFAAVLARRGDMAAAKGDFDSQTADVARAIREAAGARARAVFRERRRQAFLRRAAAPRLRCFATADGGRRGSLRAVGIVYLRARGDAAFGDRKNARRQRSNARFRAARFRRGGDFGRDDCVRIFGPAPSRRRRGARFHAGRARHRRARARVVFRRAGD